MSVDGARYAVHDLDVQFGHSVFWGQNSSKHRRAAEGLAADTKRTLVDGSLRDITDRCTLDHVADLEPLDGLILCDATVAVRAAERIYMAATVLVATVISSLLRLWRRWR